MTTTMKRITAVVLATTLAVALSGCSNCLNVTATPLLARARVRLGVQY